MANTASGGYASSSGWGWMMEYAIMILIDGKWHEQTVKTRGNGDIVKMIGDAAKVNPWKPIII